MARLAQSSLRRSVGESKFSSSSFSDVISYLSYTEYYARDGYGI